MDVREVRCRLAPPGPKLGIPWLSWQGIRRTHNTLLHELGVHFDQLLIDLAEPTTSAAQPPIRRVSGVAGWTGAYWMQIAPVVRASLKVSDENPAAINLSEMAS
jgi:hypothetical protein